MRPVACGASGGRCSYRKTASHARQVTVVILSALGSVRIADEPHRTRRRTVTATDPECQNRGTHGKQGAVEL
jgi:hypothetical protein